MPGLMDVLNSVGRGLAYNTDEAKDERKTARDLDAYEKKLRLENELAIQLEERKQQLAEKYPQLKQAIATPWGAIVSRSNKGIQVEYEDPDVKAAYIHKQESSSGLNDARARTEPVKAGAMATRAGASVTAAEAAKERAANTGVPKPPSETSQVNTYLKAVKAAKEALPGGKRQQDKAWRELGEEGQAKAVQAIMEKASMGKTSSSTTIPTEINTDYFLQ